jgi:hypothetical protein
MTETIEVDGEEYKLEGNPTLLTVRKVQSMQMDLIKSYVSDEELKNMDSLDDESAIIEAIVESGGMDALQDVMWERSLLDTAQTISLALDSVFSPSDFDTMHASDFKELRKKSEDALGGDASDFFNGLGIDTLLNEEGMRQRSTETNKREI